jgi:hypothetical protein
MREHRAVSADSGLTPRASDTALDSPHGDVPRGDVPRGQARSQREEPLVRMVFAALATFVVWRGSLYFFDLLGLSLVPNMGPCRKQWQVFGKGHEFLNGFFRWDAGWYTKIARTGYSFDEDRASSVAFYPLFPYLARYLGKLVGGAPIAGLIISNLAIVGSVFYLRRLGGLLFNDAVGKLATILLLVFPTALFLSAFYTEGLFVFCATASMFHFFRAEYWRAGILGFCAMLTRSTGIVLFVALALDLSVRVLRRQTAFRPSMLALLAIPAGLGVFMLILHYQVNNPFAFAETLSHWGRERSWPWQSLVAAFSATDYTFKPNFGKVQRFIDASIALLFLCIGLAMAVSKKTPMALYTFVILGVLLPLCTYNLAGMNRYVIGLFPAFIFLASVAEKRPELARWLIFAFSFFLAIYSLRFMQCGWVG